MYKIRRYFAGVIHQAKKVRWPTRKEMVVAVSVVMTFVIISALALAFDDFLVTKLLGAMDSALKQPTTTSKTEEAIRVFENIGRTM